MAAKTPAYRWKVVFLTDAAPLPEQKFRSERAAYQAVNGERERIQEGVSRVKRAVVYEWQRDSGRWMTFERHDLKAEAEERKKAEAKASAIVDEVLDGDQ